MHIFGGFKGGGKRGKHIFPIVIARIFAHCVLASEASQDSIKDVSLKSISFLNFSTKELFEMHVVLRHDVERRFGVTLTWHGVDIHPLPHQQAGRTSFNDIRCMMSNAQ